MNREVIVVLGMHRSGTSAVTRGLKVLGVELGEDLIDPRADNPRGFWEKKDILRINILVLGALGIKWDSLSLVSPSRWQDSLVKELQPVAARVIRENMDLYPRWGFKDPRTLRVLPFWIGAFEQLGVTPKYLLVVRNPLSVARSLYKRDGIPPGQSCLLWSIHVIPYLAKIRSRLLSVVDYDLLMDNPLGQLKRIASQLALPIAGMREMEDYAKGFLSQNLRHSRHTGEDLGNDAKAGDLTKAAYHWLERLARDEVSLSSNVFWREWSVLEKALPSVCRSDTGQPRKNASRNQGSRDYRTMHCHFNNGIVRVPGNTKWVAVIQRRH